MKPCPWPVRDVVPHGYPFILLHDITGWSDEGLIAQIHVQDGIPFFTEEGVPAYVGLEYMAQACGAWSGCKARDKGQEPKVGFLLGSRNFKASLPYYPRGSLLQVEIREEYCDGATASFKCHIRIGDEVVAEAVVNVYQPDEPESLREPNA